jgi:hypothetical protein
MPRTSAAQAWKSHGQKCENEAPVRSLVFHLQGIREPRFMRRILRRIEVRDDRWTYPYDAVNGMAWRFVQYSSATLKPILTFLHLFPGDEDTLMVD